MPSNTHRPTERVLDILELLADHPEGKNLTEISCALNAPKGSILPLVHTMAARKFIHLNPDTFRYTIGIAAFSVGSSFTSNLNALEFIQLEMKRIVGGCGETCQLAVMDRNMLLYVAKEDSPEPIRLISFVGKHLPMYCTAIGKALLACKSAHEIKALYPNGLTPVTPKTVTDFGALFEQLDQVRSRGYATDHEEITEHLHCIAVNLCNGSEPVAGLSVSIPEFRFTQEKALLAVSLLQDAKKKIEAYFQKYHVDAVNLTIRADPS